MRERFQVNKGNDVYSADRQKIGSIEEVGDTFVRVSTGFLGLGRDLFVPFDAVSRAEGNEVYVNVTKDRIDQMGWDKKPTERAGVGRPEAGAVPYQAREATTMKEESARERPTQGFLRAGELPGHTLVDVNGNEIGKISDVGPNYAHLSTGILGMGRDLYVPFDAIDYCTPDRCFLNVSQDRLGDMGWDHRPEERMGEAGAAPEAAVRHIPLREEQIEVHKHREQVGEVVVSKHVVEERRTFDVPVTHEEVTVERHDIPDRATSQAPTGEGEVTRVPIYGEKVDVEKHPVVSEEIVVSKEEVTGPERVSGTVRREVPEVERRGQVERYVHEEETEEEARKREERERRERGAA